MKEPVLFFIVLVASLTPCNSQDKRYFEGVITYTVEYKSTTDPNDKPFGDTLIVYSKNGLIKRDYNTKQIGGLRLEVIDPFKGLIYMQLVGGDTIYWYDIRENNPYLTLLNMTRSISDEIIVGHKCQILTTQILFKDDEFSFKTDEKYFYSSVLRIDPLWFKDYKYCFSDKIFASMNALYLKYESVTPATSTTIVAREIKSLSLGNDIFAIDEDKPMREYETR